MKYTEASSTMDRRDFIKSAGAGAAAFGLAACTNNKSVTVDTKLGEMTYRTNPNSGDKTSLLGYGTMRWQMIKNADGKDVIDQDSVNELVDRAIEAGINYFDSSPVYLQGQSEQATGLALARHPRNSYFIATKLSNFSNWTKENSILMYKKSLENFQTDYLDYYLLHSVSGEAVFRQRFVDNGMMEYLMEERKAGRIRNLGFSFHGPASGFDEMMKYHEQYHWDFVQIQMNYSDWTHQTREAKAQYMYEELTKRGIPVVIMEPLLGGALAQVPDAIAKRFMEREPSRSIASWAFRFCGTHPNVLVTLSGMTYREHLEDNLKSFCPLVPLTDEELEFLESQASLMKEYPTISCTGCKYCMPCPYGIDIPAIFAHYNKCVNEGNVVDLENATPEQKEFRKARRAYLISYDRALEKVRQADHCVGCEECMSQCPQHIRIPRELQRIDRYVNNLKKTF